MPNIDLPQFAQMSAAWSVAGEFGATVLQDCVFSDKCNWLSLIRDFLDPWGLWFANVFGGKPRVGPDSETDCVALFFIASGNPVIQTWGLGMRLIEAQGCAISAQRGPCIAAFRRLALGVQVDLNSQFGVAQGRVLFAGYSKTLVAHNPCSSRAAIAARQALDNFYVDAVRLGRINPATGFPNRGLTRTCCR